MTDQPKPQPLDQLTEIAARWEHGHDELTDDCALCQGEYNEAFDLIHQ